MLKLAFLPEKQFMLEALLLAEEAAAAGEIPVGAVVEQNGRIVGRGRNRREECKNPLGHAEVEAIMEAAKSLGDWRLTGCRLYVTLEPCPMCTGAILNARLDTVVYGVDDERAGCCGTAADLTKLTVYHRPEIYRGFMEDECRILLNVFFQKLRQTGAGGTNTVVP